MYIVMGTKIGICVHVCSMVEVLKGIVLKVVLEDYNLRLCTMDGPEMYENKSN